MQFHQVYYDLLSRLLVKDCVERNERTGKGVSILRGAEFFKLDMTEILPTPGLRKVWPKVAAAETAWQLMGHNDLSWLGKHTKMWDAFADSEPCPCACHYGPGRIGSEENCQSCTGTGTVMKLDFAYGYRWRKQFGRDQVAMAMAALKKNPSDRRVWLSAWHPGIDGLGAPKQKNVPCPVGFSLNVVGGQLHMAVAIRSSDVFVGLPYDVMNYAMLYEVFRRELDAKYGTMAFTLSNAHLYEDHFEMATIACCQTPVTPQVLLSTTGLAWVVSNPDVFVDYYASSSRTKVWPTFAPKPAVAL